MRSKCATFKFNLRYLFNTVALELNDLINISSFITMGLSVNIGWIPWSLHVVSNPGLITWWWHWVSSNPPQSRGSVSLPHSWWMKLLAFHWLLYRSNCYWYHTGVGWLWSIPVHHPTCQTWRMPPPSSACTPSCLYSVSFLNAKNNNL